ncbi:arsenate reductase/protein-tyrosine-phosphatase family protein [Tomitella gaofuii]|uniref:arsenate reductase/protein-tyrosine-phosphatase family protein n=1 Tax=Tomitella gaofuii TaxID=2760083 RepID=UPI0027E502A3|nr:HAD hydrolase-like protein [Tomitella gaofuii]
MPGISPSAPLALFDLDGTIMDSADGVVGSFRAALARHGVPEPDGDLRSQIVGPPMAETMAGLGVAAEQARELLAAYHADYSASGWKRSTVFAGMADVLADMAARGVRLAVTTSKQETDARRILDAHGLAGHFEVIAGAAGERRAKADVVAHALGALGVDDPAPTGGPAVVLVGDRSHDVAGAAQHGIPVAFVLWGYGTRSEAQGAAWVVDAPEDLRGAVLRYLERRSDPDGAAEPQSARAAPSGTVHVTFVCTGNICRSPMAEQIVREHLRRAGLADAVHVTSAGTGDWHVGDPADPRARHELRAHGYGVDHAAAQVGPAHLSADLMVALDSGHRRALLGAGAAPSRVRMLRSFDPHATGTDVADPYYGADDGFATVRRQIEAAAPGIVDWARTAASGRADNPVENLADLP